MDKESDLSVLNAAPEHFARLLVSVGVQASSVITLLAAGACTIVEVSSADGAARIERGFGALSISIAPTEQPSLVRVRGVGLVSTPVASTLGYAAQDLALLGDTCRVVVWVERAEHVRALSQAMPDLNEACFVNFAEKELGDAIEK